VAADQDPKRPTQTEQQESFLVLTMIGIGHQQRVVVVEDRESLLERDAVLESIEPVLPFIPLEAYHAPAPRVNTS